MKKIYNNSIFALLVVALMNSCAENDTLTPNTAVSTAGTKANVMVINASPDGPALSTFIDNEAVGSAAAYPSGTGYNATSIDGAHNIAGGVTSGGIGGTLGSSVNAVRLYATLADKSYTTVIVSDTINRAKNGTDPGGLRAVSVTDNLTAPAAGKSGVRFFSFAVSGTNYYLSYSGTAFSTVARPYRSTTVTNSGVTTNFVSFTAINAGTYTLELRTGSASGTIVATAPGTVLADGKIYTVIARGIPGKSGAKALGLTVIQHN